jgi:hypothetical protein
MTAFPPQVSFEMGEFVDTDHIMTDGVHTTTLGYWQQSSRRDT